MASLFDMPIQKLKYVGGKRAKLFSKLGIDTVGDLLRYYPRSYEDWSNPLSIEQAPIGENCCIKAKVLQDAHSARLPGGMLLVSCLVSDGSDYMRLAFFNNPYIKDKLKEGSEHLFYGKVKYDKMVKEMVSTSLANVGSDGLHPVYHLTTGLSNRMLTNAVKNALELMPEKVNEPIPQKYIERYELADLKSAIKSVHLPKSFEEMKKARERLIFEELLVLSLGLRSIKNTRRKEKTDVFPDDFTAQFWKLLPFAPTKAQIRAANECMKDMRSGVPMNRLLQGDVGSGKTAVAAALCHSMVKSGYQCAFMAPTEILAEQHYKNLSKIFEGTDIKIELLTGGLTPKNKSLVKQRLASGETDLIVGTHALLSENVEFKNLALAVTDEQHRFGVGQRAKLLSKGKDVHLLVMSATPIPRTMALIIYGDMDISVLDELPSGRQKIDTFFIDSSVKERAYGFLKKHIDMGRQCYIVCPAVDEGGDDLISAEQYALKLSKGFFSRYRVGLLHGRMKSKDKERVMREFAGGEIDVLVATTVIEVGVDVPNAVIMLIENAERYGLSQLHQLRGRVGRGEHKSYCILVSDTKSQEAQARLKTMCATTDGFAIADEDLKQRGPGDFFGSRQHGLPELSIANLTDMKTISKAQNAADEICDDGIDKEEYRTLRAEVRRLFGKSGSRLN